MNAVGIAGWGLAGLLVGFGMRTLVQRVVTPPTVTHRVAPPAALELATAILFSVLAWRIGAEPDLFAYTWLAAIGVPLAAIDWHTRQLPTRLIWPGGLVLVALFAVSAAAGGDAYPLVRSIAGMFALVAFYGAIYLVRPGEMGGGDLRLGGLLGLALGWISWTSVLTGTLFGWFAAAIAVTVRRAVPRADAQRDLPLGPFLVAGAFVAVLIQPVL